MSDPLPLQQGVRLSVLHAVWGALHVGELDSWDLIRCAHWVHTGQDMPAAHPLPDPFDRAAEAPFGPDSATWNADLDELEPPAPLRVGLDRAEYVTPRRPWRIPDAASAPDAAVEPK